jgi:hypothetical protein
MTIGEFLETEVGREAKLETDFATVEVNERVAVCLDFMRRGNREWVGLIDDEYLTGGVRRDELEKAIEKRKPEDRYKVEESDVGPFAHALTVAAHLGDDAGEISRRLSYSQQPEVVVLDEHEKPTAVLRANALTERREFRDESPKRV